ISLLQHSRQPALEDIAPHLALILGFSQSGTRRVLQEDSTALSLRKLIEPGHRNGWDASSSASAFKRAEGQANASHDCVPGALFLSRIFQVEAMNYATCAAGKVASTVEDNVITL